MSAMGQKQPPAMCNTLRYFNSSPDVIRLAAMIYIRYLLSLRKVEDLAFARGIDICRETVRRQQLAGRSCFSGDTLSRPIDPLAHQRDGTAAELHAM